MISMSANGSSDAIVPAASFPGFILGTKLFMFDIDPDIVTTAKQLYTTYPDIDNTLLMQIEKYKTLTKFGDGLADMIDYAIFYNQLLTQAFFVGTMDSTFENKANEVWPVHAKKITALKGQKWPDDSFVNSFSKLDGTTISVEHPTDDMQSYAISISHSGERHETSNTYDFNPNNPVYPEAIWEGVTVPTLPSVGSQDTCTIIYYYKHEYTNFQITLIKGTTFSGVALGDIQTQGSVVLDNYTQDRIEFQVAAGSSDGG